MLFLSNFKQKFSKKIQNTEFHENSSGRSRPFMYGRTDTTELEVVLGLFCERGLKL